MELKDFIEKFANLLDDTDVSAIQADTAYQELEEWSSLTAMVFSMQMTAASAVTDKISSCVTV